MAITLRNTKGTALTHVELDANFTTLQNADLDSAAVTSIAQALDNAQVLTTNLNQIAGDSDVDFGTHKILYSNNYDSLGALPGAGPYHGMFAHVHSEGKAYYAHAGAWIKLADYDDIGTGIDSAKTIALIDSAYVQAREGVDSIGELSNVNMSGISNNKILKWDSAQGMFIAATDVSGGGGGGGLTYADFSVSVASPGTANLSYNNSTGVTTYTPPDLSSYLTSYTVTESDVTAHQAALSITESQISDLQSYLTSETSHADVLVDGDFGSAGFMKTNGSGTYSVDANTYVSQGSSIDMNGTELVLDADGDTSLHASTDDQIDIRVGGTDVGYFNSTGLVVDNITSQATGTPTLTSSTDIDMITSGSVTISQNSGAGGGFRVGSMTTAERNSLSASNGEIIYNTSNNQMEIYEHSAWHPMSKGSHTFNVGNSGASNYTFSDAENHWFTSTTNDPVLYLRRGETYYFVVNASGHPFQIRVSNGGSAYADGVSGNTQAVGTVVFKVPMGAPSTLYYQCTVHSGMGNTINIV